MLRSIQKMTGFAIRASDGDVGEVKDFYFEDGRWTVCYLVVDTGPWFLGRRVLIAARAAGLPQWDDRAIPVAMTRQQVKDSPDIDLAKPVSQMQFEALHDHYGWPYLWVGAVLETRPGVPVWPLWQVQAAALAEQQAQNEPSQPGEGQFSLRSAHEVIGYKIEATDGSIGHVEDFFARETDWAIRYVVVDTRDWLPGRKVLVAPSWIQEISWSDRVVRVCHTRKQIEESPQYNPVGPSPSLEYEKLLYLHYGYRTPWD